MNKILWLIVAIFLPPVAVAMISGFGFHFWLNIVLCILFYFPGAIHACYIVLTRGTPG